MMNRKQNFQDYNPNQILMFPPDLHDWLPDDHLAYFIMDVVQQLDLSAIEQSYDHRKGGRPPYDPKMMLGLLLYAYCTGTFSSRKIETATWQSIPFRVIAADQHPDHDTIAVFRKRHLDALSGLFVQVLRLCQKAGMVQLGHVALDGTKVKANASVHKAMSYERMLKKEEQLKQEIDELLQAAQNKDSQEDKQYGPGNKAQDLPTELAFREKRLKKIQEAKEQLEQEAKDKAEAQKPEYEKKNKDRQDRGGQGRPPKPPSEVPEPKAQKNFTDPDSRVMPEQGGKSYCQGFNAQAVVDEKHQVVLAADITQQTNDKQQLKPRVEKAMENLDGEKPKKLSADNGYFSEDNCKALVKHEIDGYIATGRQAHGEQPKSPRGRIPKNASIKEKMTRKLRTAPGRCTYSKRKHIVEPVFGQIKEARGFRRFSLRGLKNCQSEWGLVCLTHNILKLFRFGKLEIPA